MISPCYSVCDIIDISIQLLSESAITVALEDVIKYAYSYPSGNVFCGKLSMCLPFSLSLSTVRGNRYNKGQNLR